MRMKPLDVLAVIAFVVVLFMAVMTLIGAGSGALMQADSGIFSSCEADTLSIDCSSAGIFMQILAALATFALYFMIFGAIFAIMIFKALTGGSIAGLLVVGVPVILFLFLAARGIFISARYLLKRRPQ